MVGVASRLPPLTCWYSSVPSGPTGHQPRNRPDFSRKRETHWVSTENVVLLKPGQVHASLINKSPPCCPKKGLL